MKWEYASADRYLTERIAAAAHLDELIVKILLGRGITDPEEMTRFVRGEKVLHDPFLLTDMDKAAERVNRAVFGKEKIAVFGDYDADGITATMLVYTFLSHLGADVIYALPSRDDTGYGMNADTVEMFAKENVGLVITVDTGITSFDETELFNLRKIDVIITDHHKPRETLPNAYAVVDPYREDCDYPFVQLAGVGVAFKLICAVAGEENSDRLLSAYADMIALGTIADLMPVTDENRYLIKQGLIKLNNTPNVGIRALIEAAGISGKKLNLSNVAFALAPRINAAGRVSSPVRALKLLLETDGDEAKRLAQALCDDNTYRRELETDIFRQAVEIIESDDNIKNADIIVVSGENWHQGVIGIVAAKIVEKYGKPAVMFTNDGTVAQGSSRSVNGFNVLSAIASCGDMLIKFGGHELAAGVQIQADKVDDFRERINAYAASDKTAYTEETLMIDSALTLRDITLDTAKNIESLEPFGSQNSSPVFSVSNVRVAAIVPVGSGKHLRMTVCDNNGRASMMLFWRTKDEMPFCVGDIIDAAFSISVNVWQGREQPSVTVVDMRPSAVYLKNDPSLGFYGDKDAPGEYLPTRADFVSVYKFISENKITCRDIYALSADIKRVSQNMCALKIRIVLDVFCELGVISAQFKSSFVSLKINDLKEKVDLSCAETSKYYNLDLDAQ